MPSQPEGGGPEPEPETAEPGRSTTTHANNDAPCGHEGTLEPSWRVTLDEVTAMHAGVSGSASNISCIWRCDAPFTPVARVRIPYGVLQKTPAQSVVMARAMRARVVLRPTICPHRPKKPCKATRCERHGFGWPSSSLR